jgi:hypothetical protein
MIDYNQKSQKMVTSSPPPLQKIVPRSRISRSSRMRNVNAKTSNLISLGKNISINLNNELSSKAANNGDGIVWHRSDCGYPRVRSYGAGGRWAGLPCGYWVDSTTTYGIECKWDDPLCEGWEYRMTYADIVWYGIPYDRYNSISRVRNKDTSLDHNWSYPELINFVTRL